ncbi:ABC transporter permease [Actinokineospora sp. G85]|uniref:ABC transporter permease n=1 Tax=Actinokineospora sp. G85 TaxID=3406626 RepID=UPI003C73ED7A
MSTWVVVDSMTLTRRALAHWRANPGPLVFGMLFNAMLVLVFAYLFGGAITVPGGQDYGSYLMPGMLGMSMLFGTGGSTEAIATDLRRGVVDRFRSMPMASSAVLVGRAVADLLLAVLTLAVLVGVGLLIGWRPEVGPGFALALVLLLWFRFALTWVGVYLALRMREGVVTVVQTVEFPVGFLSGAFIPTSTMPGWLGAIADWNPLSSTVAATRELTGNAAVAGSWPAEHPLLLAVVWPAVLLAVFFPLAARAFARLGD